MKQNEFEIKKEKTCCFTGHRPQKCPWGFNEQDVRCLAMKEIAKFEIERAIIQGYTTFLCGMALGFDMICAEIVLDLKRRYPQVKLIGALPCKDQDNIWKQTDKERYRKLLLQLDGTRCVYDKFNGSECMLERNHFMINNSSLCIALYDGKPGGTAKTIQYAKEQGVKVIEIKL